MLSIAGRRPRRLVEWLLTHRRPLVVLMHAFLVAASYLGAFALRFDFQIPQVFLGLFWQTLPVLLVIRIVTLQAFELHRGLWRYVSLQDLGEILVATTGGSLLFTGVVLASYGSSFPDSVLVLDWMLCAGMVAGARLATHTIRGRRRRASVDPPTAVSPRRALMVGAGDAGDRLLRGVRRADHLNYRIVGVLDDDVTKASGRIGGIPILGTVHDLPRLAAARQVDEIVIAIPSAGKEQRRRIMAYARDAKVPVKTLPGLKDLVAGRHVVDQLRDVTPEDVLARDVVRVDPVGVREEIGRRNVLVTGAGGSIGAELCRQVAVLEPESLVMFERAESDLYFSVLEVLQRNSSVRARPWVGDITDTGQVESAFAAHRPHVVYHAAAYKHVPLMEVQPLEAIENNVFGTEKVALASQRAGVDKFVLISTDKAVRPVSVMGMTKRIAECLLLSMQGGPTTFVAVRFGNVLGSAGSVLPLFEKQLARGGPLTLTHPDATRYFMLIAEAVQLVMEAGSMGRGGEVFFLDMGDPVKVEDLAQNFIRLSGYLPGHDMMVETIGLRPGERLTEELVMDTEDLLRSEHEKIFRTKSNGFNKDGFLADLEILRSLVGERDEQGSAAHLKTMTARY